MQVWSGDAAGGADKPNTLSPLHGIAGRNLRLAHMEVARDDPIAMVDVHDIAREKEFGDECDHAPIGGIDRIAGGPSIVDAEVAAGDFSVEHPAGSELARHASGSGPEEGKREQLGRVLRLMTNVSRLGVFLLDPGFSRGIERSGEFRVDPEAARSRRASSGLGQGRRVMRILERSMQGVDVLGGARDHDGRQNRVGCVHGNRGERLETPVRRCAEMERLSGHRSRQADCGVGVPGEAIDRQSDKGPDGGLARLDGQTSLSGSGARADKRDDAGCEQTMSEKSAWHRRKIHEWRLTPATAFRGAGTNER